LSKVIKFPELLDFFRKVFSCRIILILINKSRIAEGRSSMAETLNYRTYSPQSRLICTQLKSLSLEARGMLEILRDYCWTEGFIWSNFDRWRSCYGISPQTSRRLFPQISQLFSLSEDGLRYVCDEVLAEKTRINLKGNSKKLGENSGKTPVKLGGNSGKTPVKPPQNSEFLSASPIIATIVPDISKVRESKVKESKEEGNAQARTAAPPSPSVVDNKSIDELDLICQAITAVTGVKASGWQMESKIRGIAIQVQCNGDTAETLYAAVKARGKPFNLNFLLVDYQAEKVKSNFSTMETNTGGTPQGLSPRSQRTYDALQSWINEGRENDGK
jgi:hypothetical protein